MSKRWRIRPHDPDRILGLEKSARVPTIVAQLLLARGIVDPDEIREFLDPKLTDLRDPGELPGVPEAAELIFRTIEEGARITIYGDYDADGITSTAILQRCLTLLKADVHYYMPNRLEEGYGLNDQALKKIADDGTQLVITVDCGIASVPEVEKARALGLQLIITDHHAMADKLPSANVLVHPALPGADYPFVGLCGAGVAFKLAWALCQRASGAKRVSPPMREFLMQAIGLAAIGTVADVVPLVDENRILVTHGLNSLQQRPTLGLLALMKITDLSNKPTLGSEDIGFTIAPRLNAAGRLGQAQLAVELLVTENEQRASSLADYIHQLNNSRGSLERSIYKAANKQAKEKFDPEGDPALVLADHDWHPGVIGIIAGRMAEKYHRPVVIISLDKLGIKPGTGSARSVAGFNLHKAFQACTEHLVGHGGHAAAAGLRVAEKDVDAFRIAFCEYAASEITPEQRDAEFIIDAETSLSSLTLSAINQMERLAPFGKDNARPLLCTSGVQLVEPPKRMGGGGRHVSFQLKQHNVRFRAVAFGKGDWVDELTDLDELLDIAFRPVINHFRGRHTVELHLADWRPTAVSVQET